MSDLNRLRELAALLRPRVTEARVRTRFDLERKFKSMEEGVDAALKDLLFELGEGGTLETMMDDVGVSSHKDAAAILKEVSQAAEELKKKISTAMMEAEGLLFSALTEGLQTVKINVKDPKIANMLSTMGSLRCTRPDPEGNCILKGTADDIKKAQDAFKGKFTLTEMAAIGDFSSGWLKGRKAKDLVAAFKGGEETVDLSDGSKFKAVKKVAGQQIAKGMVVLASYNQYNQGAELYEILGVSDKDDEDKVKYDSVKDAMKAHSVETLKELEEVDCHLVVRDLEDGQSGGFFYLYKGFWARGSGAERLSFTLVEKVAGKTNEAKNHMDESTYQSVASWKRALKAKHGDKVWYDAHEGTIDAFTGTKPFKKGETQQVGDWDDTTGTVY